MKIFAGVVSALLVSVALAPVAAESPPAGDAANGKKLFMSVGCYQCHGTTGAGGGLAGPKLTPNPLPFMAVKVKLRTASGRMPVFSEAVLKDSDITDIYAYLQGIPSGPNARDIAILNR